MLFQSHISKQSLFIALLSIVLLPVTTSFACPKIGGLVDFNCDGMHKIAITGDSLVKGIGDVDSEDGGGYVSRLSKMFPHSKIENIGIPGITSDRLLRAFKSRLSKRKDNTTKQKTFHADLFIIDVGRNDYWKQSSPATTANNIKRLVKYLKEKSELVDGVSPIFSVEALVPSRRPYQQPFISSLNAKLIKMNSRDFPVDLTLRPLPSTIIGGDGIHPSSQGYDEIALKLKTLINTKVQKKSSSLRPDRDIDGIYDLFEIKKFFTNPLLVDTDNDGLGDGLEIFTYHTDPLSSDTDGDGIQDSEDPDTFS